MGGKMKWLKVKVAENFSTILGMKKNKRIVYEYL